MDFTDREQEYFRQEGYVCDESALGMVYYRAEGLQVTEPVAVNYMEYPWITCFEVEGIRIAPKEKSG